MDSRVDQPFHFVLGFGVAGSMVALEFQSLLNAPLTDLQYIHGFTSRSAFPLRLGLWHCWIDAYSSPKEVFVSVLGIETTVHLEVHACVDETPRGGLASKQRQHAGLVPVFSGPG
jgi:hypothetical protein